MELLARRLVMTAKALRAHFESRLAEAGASLPFWIVLHHLAESDGISQRELAGRIGVEAPTLARHLDRMEADGLIERRRDAADRRVTRVHVSTPGRRLHRRLARVAQELNAELAALLPAREAEAVDRALQRIERHLEASHAG
jgi:MarR family transcriptional regulator for hemolysin